MNWLKWVRRAVLIVFVIFLLCITGWIFWPGTPPTERELLKLVPGDVQGIVLQRNFADHWKSLHGSAFFQAVKEHSLLPARVEADSITKRVVEQAVLDLLGARAVVFVPRDFNRICLVAPVTPWAKWLWLRASFFQLLPKSGFTIFTGQVQGQTISEIQLQHSADVRLHFGRRGKLFAVLFGGSAETLAAVLRTSSSAGGEAIGELAASNPGAIHLGQWQREAGTATWIVSRAAGKGMHIELTLPKQRTVRLPWDATRGPRSMALIQKLFPDQGVMTFRGRASHWMAAWDNIAVWLGLPGELYSEALQTRLKYGEHLSHGIFPWSGAGDELACAVMPAVADTPTPWPSIVGAVRCWETNDMQVAMNQFLPSLGRAIGASFPLDPPSLPDGDYVVQMEHKDGRNSPLFAYRYADGLVIGSNSRQTLHKFDPAPFAGQTLETVAPENQLWCKPAEIAPLLEALAVLEQFRGNPAESGNLAAAASVMKAVDEMRLTTVVENETVRYQIEISAR